MSDILQPGHHPDVDQINAFIENALPLHERQATLAHLATCADCREIVYLSQQSDAGKFAAPQATATRKPWFYGWKFAWPAAAALACSVIFVVHLHNIRISNRRAVMTTTAAIERTPPGPTLLAAPHPATPDQPKAAHTYARNNRPIVTPSGVAIDTVSEANTGSIDGTSQQQNATALSPQAQRTTPLPPAGPAPATGSIHESAFKSTYASGGPAPKPISGPFGGLAIVNHPQPKAVGNGSSQSNPIDFSARRALNHQSPMAAPATVAVTSTNQAVDVNRAPTTIDTTASGQLSTEKLLPTLPSHLPVLSTVSKCPAGARHRYQRHTLPQQGWWHLLAVSSTTLDRAGPHITPRSCQRQRKQRRISHGSHDYGRPHCSGTTLSL